MIRYLSNEEKPNSIGLYREAFPEDSNSFIAYYYSEKTRDNMIIVDELEGRIRTMAHLNPYRLRLGDRECSADYIVAVATAKDSRRQGLMRGVIHSFLNDMYERGRGFTFLLPANPAYYEPFDFRYISDMPDIRPGKDLNRYTEKHTAAELMAEDSHVLKEIQDFICRWLDMNAGVFCIRDDEYMKRLLKELESEDGYIELIRDENGRLAGERMYWGIDKKEMRESLIIPEYAEAQREEKPGFMARIVNLEEFISCIHLKAESMRSSEAFKLRISDSIIEENNGTYLWHMNRESSYLERLEREESAALPEFDIAELTEWLFGYRDVSKADFCSEVETLKNIFLDEVV